MTTVAGISPVITRRGEALVRVKQRKKIHRRLTAVASRNEKVDGALGKSLPEDETQRLDLGTRLLGAVTETLVRAPTAFVVERVLAPLYPERECGPGRYRDPETDSCVFLCREGYVSILQPARTVIDRCVVSAQELTHSSLSCRRCGTPRPNLASSSSGTPRGGLRW